MLFLCSQDRRIRECWKRGLVDFPTAYEFDNYHALVRGLNGGNPELIFLDLDLPELDRLAGSAFLLKQYAPLYFFGFARKTDDPEGLGLLWLGFRGYGNVDMNSRLLKKAAHEVLNGQLWFKRRLVSRFVEEAQRALNRNAVPVNMPGASVLNRRRKVSGHVGRNTIRP